MTEKPDGDALFQQWLKDRLLAKKDPIRNTDQAKSYAWIWSSWCDWLMSVPEGARKPRARAWHVASRDLVESFIATAPRPAAIRRRKEAKVRLHVSQVTQLRYRRVLTRIYEFAVQQGLVDSNPAALPKGAKKPKREHADATVLPDVVWMELQDMLPAGDDWLQVRDRAVMGLFMEMALTPEEVVSLPAPSRPLDDPDQVHVHVIGTANRPHQTRDLLPSPQLLQDLMAWDACRKRLTAGKSTPNWFLSQRLGPLSRHTLFQLVAPLVAEAGKRCGEPFLNHVGPMVLRNTQILRWLRQGQPMAEVLGVSGLKEAKNLARITVHLTRPPQGAAGAPRPRGPVVKDWFPLVTKKDAAA
jgi:integrase/recombinase XerC